MRAPIRLFATCGALAALLALVHPASSARAAAADTASVSWAEDPIQVFYPRRDCRGAWIELERWNRTDATWQPHPGHARVRVDSCQVEDAGYLLNEIRWRCVEPPDSEPPPVWIVGLEVFESEVMQRCGEGPQPGAFGDLELHVEDPAPGETVRAPEMEVAVEGSVRIDGIAGNEYDLLLVIDRSAAMREGDADLLAAQVQAAYALIDRLSPRLGPVRIGIVSYPNLPPVRNDPASIAAYREAPLTADASVLRGALRGLLRRGASGFQTFGSAFAFALSELEGRTPGSAPRPGARKVLVMGADAGGRIPFGRGAVSDGEFMASLRARLARAQSEHVSLYFFGLGGLSEDLPPELAALLEGADARFQRVLLPSLGEPFYSAVSLPQVTQVVVENQTTGGAAAQARVSPTGSFATRLAAASGTNRMRARATLSDGTTTEREWSFDFDDRLVRERLLAAEREHMRRVRQKRLRLEPMWDEELPPPPEELEPDVAAEPPR